MCDIKNCETFLPYDQINNNWDLNVHKNSRGVRTGTNFSAVDKLGKVHQKGSE